MQNGQRVEGGSVQGKMERGEACSVKRLERLSGGCGLYGSSRETVSAKTTEVYRLAEKISSGYVRRRKQCTSTRKTHAREKTTSTTAAAAGCPIRGPQASAFPRAPSSFPSSSSSFPSSSSLGLALLLFIGAFLRSLCFLRCVRSNTGLGFSRSLLDASAEFVLFRRLEVRS